MKKILIAGTNSGVGKTTISLGIMQALTKRNLKVQPYKVGPDYIDPSYHTFITKRNSRNLDSYMLDDEKIKYIVKNASKDADISVIEGVMGLYDGYGIDLDDCTSSYTSKMLKAPVILVINAKAMATSAAAMVLGYKMLDKNVNIAGVIANNVKSESHYNILKEEGITAIMVTHDIGEAASISSKVIVMSKRPSKIKNVYLMDYQDVLKPLERRKSPLFNLYYNKLWRDIDEGK